MTPDDDSNLPLETTGAVDGVLAADLDVDGAADLILIDLDRDGEADIILIDEETVEAEELPENFWAPDESDEEDGLGSVDISDFAILSTYFGVKSGL